MPPFSFGRWIQEIFAPVQLRRRGLRRKLRSRRLSAERLEERQLLTTYTVTSRYGSGPGSLEEAINMANAKPDADTIVFASDNTIFTRGAYAEGPLVSVVDRRTGREERYLIYGYTSYAITSDVTIDGAAVPGLELLASDSKRLFVVAGKNAATEVNGAKLTLKNLTISKNKAEGASAGYGGAGAGLGGAIFVDQGATLDVSRVEFRECSAVGGVSGLGKDRGGGGMAWQSSSSEFDGAGARGGRGIKGSAGEDGGFGGGGGGGGYKRISSSQIDVFVGGRGGFGGGGGAGGGSGKGALSRNTGGEGGFGGGAGSGYVSGERPAKGGFGAALSVGLEHGGAGAGMGGAIFNYGGTVTVRDSRFNKNSAIGKEGAQGLGGALFNLGGTVTLTGCTFDSNVATTKGGAIYNAEAINDGFSVNVGRATMTITNCTIDNNKSNFGGAVYNGGILNTPDSTLTNNEANVQGGAYYNAVGATMLVARDTITNNEATRDGGGIANYGTLTLNDVTLADNEATRHNGGGLANFGTADVEGGTFRRNGSGLDGGGVSNAKGAKLDLTGVSLIQNDAGHDGGAIFDRGLEEITECELVGNTAENAGAGFFELGGIGETFLNSIVEDGNQVINSPDTVLGAAAGSSPTVQLRNVASDRTTLAFEAYAHSFQGGVRVAQGYLADRAGLPTSVIVTVPASGALPVVRIFDAFEGGLIREFRALSLGNGKGATLAVADVTGDGLDDIILGSGGGVPSRVSIYNGADGKLAHSFAPFAATFPGGIQVAAGETTGDGTAEIVVASGSGATHPGVAVFNAQGKQRTAWPLAAAQFAGGVNVAVVDRNGDGYGDVVVAQAAGGSQITIFDGRGQRTPLATFSAYPTSYTGGVNITADDVDGDGLADLVVSPANGNTQQVRAFNARTFKIVEKFTADVAFKKGIYVG
jgi:predicted outer membrane repeat protein